MTEDDVQPRESLRELGISLGMADWLERLANKDPILAAHFYTWMIDKPTVNDVARALADATTELLNLRKSLQRALEQPKEVLCVIKPPSPPYLSDV